MIHINQTPNPNYITAQMNFIFRARMLWRDLASWLRAYKVSLYGGVGNTDDVSRRLYRIPLEYGNILRVFFGDQITEQFIQLLSQYIVLLQNLFIAQIKSDGNSVNNLTQQIYQNINSMATLLESVNPYWMRSEWAALLTSFTSMQLEEATTFLTQDYTRNIDIFDRILSLTTLIGDYFSEGLTSYFNFIPQVQRQ